MPNPQSKNLNLLDKFHKSLISFPTFLFIGSENLKSVNLVYSLRLSNRITPGVGESSTLSRTHPPATRSCVSRLQNRRVPRSRSKIFFSFSVRSIFSFNSTEIIDRFSSSPPTTVVVIAFVVENQQQHRPGETTGRSDEVRNAAVSVRPE